ncbi:TPA: outer membrane lipid asymmetry maintenance protein MlaD, partial [Escherichia coli]|nr:outer membrane lipid asymmetry maintenance protein MlaD [Escherichia coli]MCO1625179.1 outer membrane lipid asymmetry maintenance protein MlaD [Escherichia coli]
MGIEFMQTKKNEIWVGIFLLAALL